MKGTISKLSAKPVDPYRAADVLADLVNRRLGADTDRAGIRKLIRDNWDTISLLAHAIRDDVEIERDTP
jgi:hypothetical protein